ncbi:GntR family transcriptional regulator [Pantoea sp. CCBC3-3-1]|uniref:GntR family transcriptional regulator n=1 Tax=Pantoea sp. CCBC3-3-1 TaxID=2490851 RepID=UPI0020C39A49|nr:GntR family transcriptional regulator [Pantoea sp. CCBC3-3-1]
MMTAVNPLPQLDREKPVKMQVYTWLRHAIIKGALHPGAIIDKTALAADMGISPTPLREALILLKHDGFIEMIPNLHTIATLIDTRLVKANALIRYSLEASIVEQIALDGLGPAVESACLALVDEQERSFDARHFDRVFECDLAFHKTLCDVLALPTLWHNLSANRAHLDRARQCSPVNLSGIQKAIADHRELVSLLKTGDAVALRNLMKLHVYSVFDDLKNINPEWLVD